MKRSLEGLLKIAAREAEKDASAASTAEEMRRDEAEEAWWKQQPALFAIARQKLFSLQIAHADAPADVSCTAPSVCRIPAIIVHDEGDAPPAAIDVIDIDVSSDALTLRLRLCEALAVAERRFECAFVPARSEEPIAVEVADFTRSPETKFTLYPDETVLDSFQRSAEGGHLPFRLMLRPAAGSSPRRQRQSITACFRAFIAKAEEDISAAATRAGVRVSRQILARLVVHARRPRCRSQRRRGNAFLSWLDASYGDQAQHMRSQIVSLAPFSQWPELEAKTPFVQCVFLDDGAMKFSA